MKNRQNTSERRILANLKHILVTCIMWSTRERLFRILMVSFHTFRKHLLTEHLAMPFTPFLSCWWVFVFTLTNRCSCSQKPPRAALMELRADVSFPPVSQSQTFPEKGQVPNDPKPCTLNLVMSINNHYLTDTQVSPASSSSHCDTHTDARFFLKLKLGWQTQTDCEKGRLSKKVPLL